jgi:tRNA threonylcarbamoyladenosine biosynthesis protein TsaB
MSNLLAVDTTSKSCSVAVILGQKPAIEITAAVAKTHATQLLPMIRQALRTAAATVGDLDAMAVTIGPGSFTGLRIGLSTVQGLAFAGRTPVIGVSSLEALAYQGLPWPQAICAMLDARRGEVYSAFYRACGERLEREGPERVLAPESLLAEVPRPCLFVGDGARLHRALIENTLGDSACFAPPERHVIRASSVAAVARPQLEGLRPGDGAGIVPRYVRRADAEGMTS